MADNKYGCYRKKSIKNKNTLRNNNNSPKLNHYSINNEDFLDFPIDDSELIEGKLLDYISIYFEKEIELLDSKQIIELAKFYDTKFEKLCVSKAKELKSLIINYYRRIRGLESIPLRTIFSFDLGTRIRKVLKRENVTLSKNTLIKIKEEIDIYRNTYGLVNNQKKDYYNKIFNFINKHIEFSGYIEFKKSGKFKISDIKLATCSNELELRSWLFENLRYAFPTKFGIPLDNNLLSWFLFNDDPDYGEQSSVNFKLTATELYKRFELRELLAIEYRVSRLTIDDFRFKRINISDSELRNLKLKISYLIYYYVFFMEHEKPYVADSTSSGIKTGTKYWTPEYFVIKAVFFSVVEANEGEIKDFKTIGEESGVNKIQSYLRKGDGFGNTYLDLLEYVQDLYKYSLNNSDIEVFKESLEILEKYDKIYFERLKRRNRALGDYGSHFEKNVHFFLINKINSSFLHQIPLIKAIGKRKICYKDHFNNTIYEKIHPSYHYDFYLELNDNLRKFFNLNNKWKAIAVEAQGSYWHGDDFSDNIKSDKFKRLVSKLEDIILIEIWDNVEESLWNSEFHNQLKKYRELK